MRSLSSGIADMLLATQVGEHLRLHCPGIRLSGHASMRSYRARFGELTSNWHTEQDGHPRLGVE